MHIRNCKQCNKVYRSPYKYSSKCPECRIHNTRRNWGKNKMEDEKIKIILDDLFKKYPYKVPVLKKEIYKRLNIKED